MKKILMTLAVVASLGMMLCFTGCSPSTPDKVAVAFFEKFTNGDFDGAAKYGSKTTQAMLSMVKSMGADKAPELNKMKGAKVEVVGEPTIDGDKAKVKVRLTKDGENDDNDVDLVKEDGNWKVDMKKN